MTIIFNNDSHFIDNHFTLSVDIYIYILAYLTFLISYIINIKKMKSRNCSVFLNVYVTLIYVVMWRNKEQSIKSQTFRLLIII